jgi:hypothetical protein
MTEAKQGSADAELKIPKPHRSLERLLRHHLHSHCRQTDRRRGNSCLDFHLLLSFCVYFCRYPNRSLWVCNRATRLVVLHLRATLGDRNFRICDFLSALRGYDKQSLVRCYPKPPDWFYLALSRRSLATSPTIMSWQK